jgi:hypothetical protein
MARFDFANDQSLVMEGSGLIDLLHKSPFMTTPRIHLGLKPQAIGSNPLKRVHESIGVAVMSAV